MKLKLWGMIAILKRSPILLFCFLILQAAKPAFSGDFVNFINMEFVDIQEGHFFMGSCNRSIQDKKQGQCKNQSPQDENAFRDELPKHHVKLTKKIQMGVHEVSVKQYMHFVEEDGADLKNNKDFLSYNPTENNRPVTYLSWGDVERFLSWLNREKPAEDPALYRLPTEAEWEYAARAGKTTIYFFSNSPSTLVEYAWYEDGRQNQVNPVLHPIGSKQPNPWGVYDMFGNVWEWVADWYDSQYYDNSSFQNPRGPNSGQKRVIRGGAFNFDATYCRAAARESYPPNARSRSIGFRVVRELAH